MRVCPVELLQDLAGCGPAPERAADLPPAAREAIAAALRNGPCLAACSGGSDSVALLHALLLAGVPGLHVAHLNHRLRGADSDEDEAFVRGLASTLDLPVHVRRTDVAERAAARAQSLETAGREARREFLAEVARHTGARVVFLGHQADDQAETVLMQVLRGSGLRGMGGMRAASELTGGVWLLRPFLDVPRRELAAWLRERSLPWREDASNAEDGPWRNRVRRAVLPLLEAAAGRPLRQSLLRLARIAAAEDAFLNELAQEKLAACRVGDRLATSALLALPTALRRRVVRLWLVGCPDVGFSEIEGVLEIASPTAPRARVNLPGGWRAARRAGLLRLEPPEDPHEDE